MRKDNRNENREILPVLGGIVPALLAVCLAVTAALQCRFLYARAIDTFRLTEASGLSKERLMENYRILIEYNTPFGPKELSFPDFPVSGTGAIHFAEVRTIFLAFAYAIPILLALFLLLLLWGKRKGDFRFLLSGSLLSLLLPAALGLCCALDWDETFVKFHELVFDNDYWIFDAATDPVIRVLPDGFFLWEAVLIFVFIALQALLLLLWYRRKSRELPLSLSR